MSTNSNHPDAKGAVPDELQSRRTLLRGALLAGCTLLMPISLLSACSRESESTAPTLASKLPKSKVKYQEQPKGTQKCSNCMNYIAATKECQRVEGQVSPEGWCVYWGANA